METKHEEGWTASADGTKLFWQSWARSDPRAVLLFVHGLAEHSGRYRNPVEYFTQRAVACYGFDYRGHGRSSGLRVHIDGFDDFLADVRAGHAVVRERAGDLPVFLVGHSQGGLIALRYVLDGPEGLSGLILSSPMLGIHPSSRPSLPLAVAARVLSRIMPTLRLPSGIDARLTSRDQAVVEAYQADPLVSSLVSARWYTAILGAMEYVHAEAKALSIPTLVMAAGDDGLVDAEATRRWVDQAPRGLVEYEPWPGLYHELFNEPEKREVFALMESWLERRLGGAPAPEV